MDKVEIKHCGCLKMIDGMTVTCLFHAHRRRKIKQRQAILCEKKHAQVSKEMKDKLINWDAEVMRKKKEK